MMTDPIADMLTRIRNGNRALRKVVTMPSSKMKEEIAKLLASEGYVEGYDVSPAPVGKQISIRLKYAGPADRDPILRGLRRISSPGRRIYKGADELPRSQGGLGTIVVSTSRGLMADREARRRRLGGEIVCEVW